MHKFILKINGINIFQWFKDMVRKLIERLEFIINTTSRVKAYIFNLVY